MVNVIKIFNGIIPNAKNWKNDNFAKKFTLWTKRKTRNRLKYPNSENSV